MLTILFIISIVFNIFFLVLIVYLLCLKYLKSKNNVLKIFSIKEVYEKIFKTIKHFSLNKIDAIITFEKNFDLNNKISKSKSGVLINNVLSSEFLMTFFLCRN